MKITADFMGQTVKAFDLSEYETFIIEVEGKRLQIVRSKLAGMTPGRLPLSSISSRQKKNFLTISEKKKAVLYARKHGVSAAARQFGTHRESVRHWMKGQNLGCKTHARSRKAS